MMRATLRRKATTWAVLLGCGFALVHCGHERIAGSSVTTGNPTEIQVGFTGENGPLAIAGRVEIYGATQIPVPGFRPEPLKRYDVDGNTFSLTASHFEGIADSLWANGSLEGDSLARFNLVVTGATEGAILRDMGYRLKDGKFSLKDGSYTAGMGGVVKMAADVKSLVAYQASIDTATLINRKIHYLFLYGTGYYAKGEAGLFSFPNMPAGTHNPVFVSIPTKESQATSPQDSVNVHQVGQPLSTGTNPTVVGGIIVRIPIPEELR